MDSQQVVCDTDVMINYLDRINQQHADAKKILEEKIGLDNIFISAITKMELLRGATNKTDLIKINKSVARFNSIPIDNSITQTAVELIQTYVLSHKLSIPDGLIAATSIETRLPLFTYNIRDYKFITKLKLYKH